ncbi:N-acetylglucosamine kinase [Glaciibacter superstes]|uniref:N-acetylglucosamine kinase n=1 Tax=Glaciibacter superstes TaxID=501023 RepID=UPI0003B65FC2|nr:BadF/BadG/BcrA/BcrD ATPase family protein [Glaciibacter superstes]
MFLGVDGGGTKTALCLVDSDGNLVAAEEAPSSYYFSAGIGSAGIGSAGIELVQRVLKQGVDAVCSRAGITPNDVTHAFFGLPGYGEASGDTAIIDAVPRSILGHERYACDNDMVCGWAGSLGAVDGVNVISGTGSMTYGEHHGRGVRVGGWGELFGDEGSAYWIAIQGLIAFAKMSDGRLPDGHLRAALSEHLDLPTDLDLVDVVLNRWNGGRSEIAALSPVVVRAANEGDAEAIRILAEAGRELADIVDVTTRRLKFDRDSVVPVSYSGGVFRSAAVLDQFRRALAERPYAFDLREPLYPPVVGAALYAAKLAGMPLTAAALTRLQASSVTPLSSL